MYIQNGRFRVIPTTYYLSLLSCYNSNIKVFEILIATLDSGNRHPNFVNINNPPFFSLFDFLSEFQSLLEFLVLHPSELIVTGDSIDIRNNVSQKLQDLLYSFDLIPHTKVIRSVFI